MSKYLPKKIYSPPSRSGTQKDTSDFFSNDQPDSEVESTGDHQISRRGFLKLIGGISAGLVGVFGIKELLESPEIHTETISVDAYNRHKQQTLELNKIDREDVQITPKKNLDWPLQKIYQRGITSVFGFRKQFQRNHNGRDLRAAVGTPFVSSGAGRVVFSGWQTYKVDVPVVGKLEIPGWATDQLHGYGVDLSIGYGQYIIVSHGVGVYTLYAHLDTREVEVGDTIKKGQRLGTTGGTGKGAPHLHFEIRKGSNSTDDAVSPSDYFILTKKTVQ